MSTETIFRKDQIGVELTAQIKEPDPNDPTTNIVVDLTTADFVAFEFRRPNKTTFEYSNEVAGGNEVPAPSTIVIVAPTLGTIRFKDNIGIFNVAGLWHFRGIMYETITVEERHPGSWIERRVGL